MNALYAICARFCIIFNFELKTALSMYMLILEDYKNNFGFASSWQTSFANNGLSRAVLMIGSQRQPKQTN